MKLNINIICIALIAVLSACDKQNLPDPVDPDTAEKVSIDRFSEGAGTLFIRDTSNNFPGPNQPVNFDEQPFITKGLGPQGELASYYNFDVQPLLSAPVFVLFRKGESSPVEGQLNILDVIPGEEGYTDFWNMVKVTVPKDYMANSVTSYQEIIDQGFSVELTTLIINCPVVPGGSSATLRYTAEEPAGLVRGWYKGKVLYYFKFEEKQLEVTLPPAGYPLMPISGIMVTFNINPDQEGGGPESGFVTEPGTDQTHNVLETLPEDNDYSPLWTVDVYDNADFENVDDWSSAKNAGLMATGVALVNCPVVKVE